MTIIHCGLVPRQPARTYPFGKGGNHTCPPVDRAETFGNKQKKRE